MEVLALLGALLIAVFIQLIIYNFTGFIMKTDFAETVSIVAPIFIALLITYIVGVKLGIFII